MNPGVIIAAAASPLGVLALLILVLSGIATAFFRDSGILVRLGIFAVMFGAVVAFGIVVMLHQGQGAATPVASGRPVPASGIWDFVINCPNSDVREPDAQFSNGKFSRGFSTGTTTASMNVLDDRSVHLNGDVQFNSGTMLNFNATGTGENGSFAGTATYGTYSGCHFAAVKKSD